MPKKITHKVVSKSPPKGLIILVPRSSTCLTTKLCNQVPSLRPSKGRLILKGLFGSFNSPKKRTKHFCPSRLGQKLTFSSSFFGRIEDTKISFRDWLGCFGCQLVAEYPKREFSFYFPDLPCYSSGPNNGMETFRGQ